MGADVIATVQGSPVCVRLSVPALCPGETKALITMNLPDEDEAPVIRQQ